VKTKWHSVPERGSDPLIRFVAWLSLRVGRPVVRLLLYPIMGYFFLSSKVGWPASRKYLAAVFGRPPTLGQCFRHHMTFARVTHDRIHLLAGRLEEFEVSIKGLEVVEAQLEKNQGCLFLGAHLGSFEVLRTFGMLQENMPIKILLYPENARRTIALMETLNPELAQEIIPLGRANSMILAKRHVDDGGIIGVLGDRVTRGDKVVRANFLGQPADFPVGPMLLASMLKVPVVLFCGLYLGGTRYEINFELFADGIVLDPETRQQDLQRWIDRYAARLDHFCRQSPYNWFNFYDFWEPSNEAK
jgi:predicted LPLAT superfamily acyltransferase